MTQRSFSGSGVSSFAEISFDALGQEILAEKAASLGRAGRKAEAGLAALREHSGDPETRAVLVKSAADAVYAWFIQRELCGLRRHHDVIRDYAIPNEVLVRLGAK